MKFLRIFLCAFCCIFLIENLASADVVVNTRPADVTVYPGSARVLRKGKINLPAGESVLVFPGLPARLEESSLRLSAEGVSSKLAGVKLRQSFSDVTLQKLQRGLSEKIQGLEDSKQDLEDQIAARNSEAELLKNLADKAAKRGTQNAIEKGGPLADFTLGASNVGRRLASLTAANRKDERQVRDIVKKIEAVRAELNAAGAGESRSRVAEAVVELKEAGELRIEISYLIAGASWQPVYDARVSSESEKPKLFLTFLADVRQNTGENWDNVKLQLSTARPTEGTTVPDPTQWWLDVRPNYPAVSYKQRRGRSNAKRNEAVPEAASADMIDLGADVAAEASAPMQLENAQTLSGEFATGFVVRRPQTVRSDGSAQRVAISEGRHDAELKLVVIPRLEKAAFVQARVVYTGEQPLLPGAVNLFQDDQFVGNSSLKSIGPGESFELGLGKDERIKVERERVSSKTSSGSGFMFSKDSRKYHWLIKFKNLHKGVRNVEVLEQLPRSRRDEIKVSEIELKPEAQAEDSEKPGLKKWTLSMQPGEEKKITFRYEVKYREGLDVMGLE